MRQEGEGVPGTGVLTCPMDKITGMEIQRGLLCVTPSCDSTHEEREERREKGKGTGAVGKSRCRKKVSKHRRPLRPEMTMFRKWGKGFYLERPGSGEELKQLIATELSVYWKNHAPRIMFHTKRINTSA